MFVVEVSVVCGVVVCGEMPTRFVVGWDCRLLVLVWIETVVVAARQGTATVVVNAATGSYLLYCTLLLV